MHKAKYFTNYSKQYSCEVIFKNENTSFFMCVYVCGGGIRCRLQNDTATGSRQFWSKEDKLLPTIQQMLEDSIGPLSSGGEGSVSYTCCIIYTHLFFVLHFVQDTLRKGIPHLRPRCLYYQ